MKHFSAIILAALLAAGTAAEARVFSFKDAGLAAYLRGTGGLSSVKQEPFNHSSGSDTEIDGQTRFDYSGELGLMLGLSSQLRVRVGAEVIQHRPISNQAGTNPAGAERFRLDSNVSVFNPNLTFEYAFENTGETRFYGYLGGGYAQVTAENSYKMTTQGTTDLGVTDFKDTLVSTTASGHIGVGLETLFTDNATFSMDIGYRYLPVRYMTYKNAVKNILSPTTGVQAGDPVLNQDGSRRKMDLGGLTVGVIFRFYLNFI